MPNSKHDKTEARRANALVPSLVRTIADKGAAEALIDTSEVVLDQLLSADTIGVLEEVPLVGLVVKTGKVGLGIREQLFLKKIARFLVAIETVPEADREAFRKSIEANPKLTESVGTKLMLLLERADDLEKPSLLGKAFAAYLRRDIDFDQFIRMASGIDRALMPDLTHLAGHKDGFTEEEWGADLVAAGLTRYEVSQLIGGNKNFYRLTEAGQLVKRFCLL